MRNIKFRLWDKINSQYYSPTYEAYKGKLDDLLISPSGRLVRHTLNGMADESMFPDQYILEQFTGLLDKNGKEIYEGDIVKQYHSEGVVAYHEERAMFIINDGFNEPLYQDIRGVEIIGNIHEKPELLK